MPVNVIYLPISENFTSEDKALMRFVPQNRTERIERFRRNSDRRTSLYATLLVAMYLRLHYDIPADRLHFERTPDGKPYTPGLPVRFSCSHTDGAVLAAFSTLDETGCDVELIADPPYQISSIAFSQNERDALDQCGASEERRALTFYTIWTRKESYLKYLGTGLAGDITKTDVYSPAISGRFISKRISSHMCSVFNSADEPVNFTTMDESDVCSFFIG